MVPTPGCSPPRLLFARWHHHPQPGPLRLEGCAFWAVLSPIYPRPCPSEGPVWSIRLSVCAREPAPPPSPTRDSKVLLPRGGGGGGGAARMDERGGLEDGDEVRWQKKRPCSRSRMKREECCPRNVRKADVFSGFRSLAVHQCSQRPARSRRVGGGIWGGTVSTEPSQARHHPSRP
jgi:hypothetical protein